MKAGGERAFVFRVLVALRSRVPSALRLPGGRGLAIEEDGGGSNDTACRSTCMGVVVVMGCARGADVEWRFWGTEEEAPPLPAPAWRHECKWAGFLC